MTYTTEARSHGSVLAYLVTDGEYVPTGEVFLNARQVYLDEQQRRELAAYLLQGLAAE